MIEQTVAGGEPQTVTVPAYTYDYSQPIDTQSAPPPAEVADPAVAKFDSARAAFGNGDYAGALKLTDDDVLVFMIWRELPMSGLTIIGVLVGISLIFRGVSWLMVGFALKRIPVSVA